MQKAQLLSKQEIDAIFPTEDTLMLHTAILAELEVALAKPAEKQNVGEVFIKKVRTPPHAAILSIRAWTLLTFGKKK